MVLMMTQAVVLVLFCCPIALFSQVPIDPDAAEALLLERPVPVYAELARRARIEGTVKLLITVSETGFVRDVRVLSGHPLLDGGAVDAVWKSKYKPYAPEGRPVPFVTVIEIPFSLLFSQKDYERDQALARQYSQQEGKCRDLLNASKWQQAEEVCGANLALADKLSNHRGLIKMRAYQMAGFSVLGQEKYKEALKYLNRALKLGKSSLKDNDAGLGDVLVTLGITYSKMGDPDKARDCFAKGEKALQSAYDNPKYSYLRNSYLPRLKTALQCRIDAAKAAGDSKEAELLSKRLAGLP